MDTLWRWSTSSSAILLLILNVGQNLCQNVGQMTLQEESINGCNPRCINPTQQINDLVLNPQNCIVPGDPTQDFMRTISQNLPMNHAPKSFSFSQPIAIQSQCTTPPKQSRQRQNVGLEVLSQPQVPRSAFPQGVIPNPGSLTATPLKGCSNSGIDVYKQGLQIRPQVDSLPFPNGPQCLDSQITVPTASFDARQCRQPDFDGPNSLQRFNQINALAPAMNVRQPDFYGDVFGPQELKLPSSCSPLASLHSPGLPACLPPVTSKGPILTVPQSNCLPGSISSQCNCLKETPSCLPSVRDFSSADCPLQIALPLTPCNTFRFPKPTLFPSETFQGPLASPPCDPICPSPSINKKRDLIQEGLLFPQQGPVVSCPIISNSLLSFSNQNQEHSLIAPPVCQPLLSSNSVFCSTDQTSTTNRITQPNIVQPCPISQNILGSQAISSNCAPICPMMNVCPSQCPSLYPLLPTPLNVPICDVPCRLSTTDLVPTPINLKINVPPPNIPPPKITIINLTPQPAAPVASTADEPNLANNIPIGMPPVIIEERKSRSRSWWPLLLVALFAGNGGYGC